MVHRHQRHASLDSGLRGVVDVGGLKVRMAPDRFHNTNRDPFGRRSNSQFVKNRAPVGLLHLQMLSRSSQCLTMVLSRFLVVTSQLQLFWLAMPFRLHKNQFLQRVLLHFLTQFCKCELLVSLKNEKIQAEN